MTLHLKLFRINLLLTLAVWPDVGLRADAVAVGAADGVAHALLVAGAGRGAPAGAAPEEVNE